MQNWEHARIETITAASDSAVVVGRLVGQQPGAPGEPPSLVCPVPRSSARRIRPGEAYGFVFEIVVNRVLMDGVAARFTDDDSLHWQIDQDLHLQPLDSRDC